MIPEQFETQQRAQKPQNQQSATCKLNGLFLLVMKGLPTV